MDDAGAGAGGDTAADADGGAGRDGDTGGAAEAAGVDWAVRGATAAGADAAGGAFGDGLLAAGPSALRTSSWTDGVLTVAIERSATGASAQPAKTTSVVPIARREKFI